MLSSFQMLICHKIAIFQKLVPLRIFPKEENEEQEWRKWNSKIASNA